MTITQKCDPPWLVIDSGKIQGHITYSIIYIDETNPTHA